MSEPLVLPSFCEFRHWVLLDVESVQFMKNKFDYMCSRSESCKDCVRLHVDRGTQ
jgi:hypothetical protein